MRGKSSLAPELLGAATAKAMPCRVQSRKRLEKSLRKQMEDSRKPVS